MKYFSVLKYKSDNIFRCIFFFYKYITLKWFSLLTKSDIIIILLIGSSSLALTSLICGFNRMKNQ